MAVLKNQGNELIDEQLTFIIVELAKFKKPLAQVQTDLDKLIYTMKTLETAPNITQYPQFWTEEWLQAAINELDTRAMTPEQRMVYEMTLSANALAVSNEAKRIEEVKAEAVAKALKGGKLTVDEIADYNGVPVDFIRQIQQGLDDHK